MAESPIHSSFIPRDASTPSTKSIGPRGGLYDLLMLVAVVLFIASAVLAVGVFLYLQFLQTESTSKQEQLQRAKAAFEPALIQKLTRLDDRMHIADELLAAHLAPSVVMQILEQTTLQTVAYRSLNFDAPNPQNITLRMEGSAESVNSIALQADLFSKSSIIVNPIFSGITKQGAVVNFNVNALINPSLIRYASLINGATQNNGIVPQTGTSSPFTRQIQ